MKKCWYLGCLMALLLCGCPDDPQVIIPPPAIEYVICQDDLKFGAKPFSRNPEFFSYDSIKYEISGGRPGSYHGNGVKNGKFCPAGLKNETHYIYYRDEFGTYKKMKIQITSLISEPEKCNCDVDYKLPCTDCDENGKIKKYEQCGVCEGKGYERNGWTFYITTKACSNCGGDKIVSKLYTCTVCKGSKKKDCDKH